MIVYFLFTLWNSRKKPCDGWVSQIGGCAIGEHVKSIEAIETDYKKHRKTIGIYPQTLLVAQ